MTTSSSLTSETDWRNFIALLLIHVIVDMMTMTSHNMHLSFHASEKLHWTCVSCFRPNAMVLPCPVLQLLQTNAIYELNYTETSIERIVKGPQNLVRYFWCTLYLVYFKLDALSTGGQICTLCLGDRYWGCHCIEVRVYSNGNGLPKYYFSLLYIKCVNNK